MNTKALIAGKICWQIIGEIEMRPEDPNMWFESPISDRLHPEPNKNTSPTGTSSQYKHVYNCILFFCDKQFTALVLRSLYGRICFTDHWCRVPSFSFNCPHSYKWFLQPKIEQKICVSTLFFDSLATKRKGSGKRSKSSHSCVPLFSSPGQLSEILGGFSFLLCSFCPFLSCSRL